MNLPFMPSMTVRFTGTKLILWQSRKPQMNRSTSVLLFGKPLKSLYRYSFTPIILPGFI